MLSCMVIFVRIGTDNGIHFALGIFQIFVSPRTYDFVK